MGILAWILGILGGLSAVAGIVSAAGVMPEIGDEFTTMFWMVLGAILLLGAIAAALGRTSYE